MKYTQIVVPISNYSTDALQKKLNRYGNEGYKFVNSVMAKNKYGVEVMYLFFVKGGEG
jgi:hypothetical protein